VSRWASGDPKSLDESEGRSLAASIAESATFYHCHCEERSDEAIHSAGSRRVHPASAATPSFLGLAMTEEECEIGFYAPAGVTSR